MEAFSLGGRWSWRSYLLARLTRLYIVLLPALVLGTVIDQAGMRIRGADVLYSGHSGMHALMEDVHETSRSAVLLGNSLFLQTIPVPGAHGQPIPAFGSNGPLWSLSNEFWYYLAFPLLVLLVAGGRSAWARAACGLGLLLWGWFVGWNILALGLTWLMGAMIPFLPSIRTQRSPIRGWIRGALIVLALALLAGGFVLGKSKGSLLSDLLLGVLVTFLIWITLYCATAPLPPVLYAAGAKSGAEFLHALSRASADGDSPKGGSPSAARRAQYSKRARPGGDSRGRGALCPGCVRVIRKEHRSG